MAGTVARIHDVEDSTVITSGDSFADALSEGYLVNFKAFMPSLFHDEFLADLREAVADYRAIPSDELFVKRQAKETLDVLMVRREVAFETRLLKVYASKTFADNPGVLAQFKFGSLSKVEDSNEKMRTFLDDIISVLDENIDTLIASDYPESKRDVFKTLRDDLDREWDEQKSLMRQRGGITDHRVRALNSIWTLMKEVSEVREFALPDDPAGQEIFRLPQPDRSSSSAEESEEI